MTNAGEIDLIGVTKRYGAAVAVHPTSLRVPSGQYCCLLGPSGCGKTSTLRMIAGHEVASDGTITIGGRNVTAEPPGRRGTAMMFQSYALFPHLNCVDNVAFSLKLRGEAKQSRRAKAREYLAMVRMAPYAERLPAQTQWRAAAARGTRAGADHWAERCCCWTSRSPPWTRNSASACGRS